MDIDIKKIERLVKEIISQIKNSDLPYVPIGVSNRHVHLNRADVSVLFGQDYVLTKLRDLKQPGQFAANEMVEIIGPKGKLSKVRVLGPVRPYSQVEILQSDSRVLGIDCPVRESGDLEGTPGVLLRGPQGEVRINQGLLVALRHIHMPPAKAGEFHYFDGQRVSVKFAQGPRKTTFHDVKIRVADNFALEMHVDIDEANAAGLQNGSLVEILAEL